MTVRTRFAPSPTGYLHIGGVRTALFNWLFAKQNGGQFVLRIDDTDQKRNLDEALPPILHGFKWLGLNWDEGPEVDGPYAPYYQSQRTARYQSAVDELLAKGAAYWDYSGKDHQAERELAEKEKRPFLYSRKWMAETEEQKSAFEAEGREGVVRLKMPREGRCEFTDEVVGAFGVDWASEGDTVIQRADGSFIYHLANVVDDEDFKITHVIRGVEHLSNTPRQIFIINELGYSQPTYAHIPSVQEPNSSKKLSKRKMADYMKDKGFKRLFDQCESILNRVGETVDVESFNPVLVNFYERSGFLPSAVLNYLVLLGWSLDGKTEEFTTDEMLQHFSLDRVMKSGASFDVAKLMSIQEKHFAEFPIKQKVAMCLPYLQKSDLVSTPPPCEISDKLTAIIDAAGDRLKIAGDILEYDTFFVGTADYPFVEKDFKKQIIKPEASIDLLTEFASELSKIESFDIESIDKMRNEFAEKREIGLGPIMNPLRVALVGKARSFEMANVIQLLGKEECIARINRAIEHAKELA